MKETKLSDYDNSATIGVSRVAHLIMNEIKPIFRNDMAYLGPNATIKSITEHLVKASENLSNKGFCLFYFHGHGDSIGGRMRSDEARDQALVCHDGYLVDDVIEDLFAKFQPEQRILTIVDCCSAGSVIEWHKYSSESYPMIIHLASSRDEKPAFAYPQGGIFSNRIFIALSKKRIY